MKKCPRCVGEMQEPRYSMYFFTAVCRGCEIDLDNIRRREVEALHPSERAAERAAYFAPGAREVRFGLQRQEIERRDQLGAR